MARSSNKERYVTALRAGLNDLHRYDSRPPEPDDNPLGDVKQLFESIPSELQPSVLDKATGKGIQRFRAAASLLAECEPSDCVNNWIAASLENADTERREWMIQIVGNHKLVRFAENIARIVDSDDACRWFAVIAAGNLRCEVCLNSLITLAESYGNEPIPNSLIQALAKFESPVVTPHLQRVFDSHPDERDRVFAAWGLARQDHQQALEYLVAKLDDVGGNFPSIESRRAAQALSDLYGWDLDWIPEAPRQAKELWQARLKNKDA